jgi:hypothetical protein
MKQELKSGDFVKDILTDEVFEVIESISRYGGLTAINIEGPGTIYFKEDGRAIVSHKNPRFIKVDKPKRRVTKELIRYGNIYPDFELSILYANKDEAILSASESAIFKGAEVRIIYEVEE